MLQRVGLYYPCIRFRDEERLKTAALDRPKLARVMSSDYPVADSETSGRRQASSPLIADLIGMLVLDQPLGAASWLAITVIVTANAVSVGTPASHSEKKTDLLRRTRADRPRSGEGFALRHRAVQAHPGRGNPARQNAHSGRRGSRRR